MIADNLLWIKAFHVFGVVMWIGTLLGLFQVLQTHAKADEGSRGAFGTLERSLAMAMDVGAGIAIVAGVVSLLGHELGAGFYLKGHGYFHLKLMLVAFLLAMHGLMRVKVKRFASGKVSAPPALLFPLMSMSVLVIIVMIVVRPF